MGQQFIIFFCNGHTIYTPSEMYIHQYFLLLLLFTLPNLGLTPTLGLTTQMPVSQMPVGGTVFGPEHQTYTRAGLPECVVNTMSGPPPETIQDRTQRKDTHPISRQKLKFLTPPGIEPGPTGWKAGTLPTTPRRLIKWVTNCLFGSGTSNNYLCPITGNLITVLESTALCLTY